MAAMSSLSSVLNVLETVRNVVASYVFAVHMEKTLLDNLASGDLICRSIFVYDLMRDSLASKLGH